MALGFSPCVRASAWPQENGRRTATGEPSNDVGFLEAVLSDLSLPDLVRRGAADRLVRLRTPDAQRALERALRAGGPQRSASLDAIDQAVNGQPGEPDFTLSPELTSALVDAAIAAPLDESSSLRSAAARVLARGTRDAASRLAAVAQDPSATAAARRGAIATLGEMRTRDAAGRLIELLAAERREDRDTIAEVCKALTRSTGADVEPTAEAWIAWWEEAGRQGQMAESQLQAMSAAAAKAEQALADERRRAQRLETRLVETYTQLFLRLNQQERLQRSATLLGDELPAVREFAVAQLERMLRNGERVDDATRAAALVVLDDSMPALRVRGARLLADLDVPDLAMRLAERLPREGEPTVAAAYLSVLAAKPEAKTFPTLVGLLRDPQLNEAACRAIIALADARRLPADWQASVVPTLRETVAARPNASSVQLLTMAGDEADAQRAIALLDDPNAGVRRGAAEGLRRRGMRRPVIERSNDTALYAPYIAALGDEPKTLETLRLLASAPPPTTMIPDWNASVVKVLRELPLADIPTADRLLEPIAGCERRTRLEGLSRIVAGARTSASQATLDEGLPRWVDLLIADGRGYQAVDQIESLSPDASASKDAPLVEALFRATALSGDFRAAAEVAPQPGRWLALLSSIVRSPTAARPLADEISLRFGGQLTTEERATLERLRRELPSAAGTAEVPEARP